MIKTIIEERSMRSSKAISSIGSSKVKSSIRVGKFPMVFNRTGESEQERLKREYFKIVRPSLIF